MSIKSYRTNEGQGLIIPEAETAGWVHKAIPERLQRMLGTWTRAGLYYEFCRPGLCRPIGHFPC